jgi:hypothetical protein
LTDSFYFLQNLPLHLKWPNDIYGKAAVNSEGAGTQQQQQQQKGEPLLYKMGGILVNSSFMAGEFTMVIGKINFFHSYSCLELFLWMPPNFSSFSYLFIEFFLYLSKSFIIFEAFLYIFYFFIFIFLKKNLGCGFNISNTLPTYSLHDMIREYNASHGTFLDLIPLEDVIAGIMVQFECLYRRFVGTPPGFGGLATNTAFAFEPFLDEYYRVWLHKYVSIY